MRTLRTVAAAALATALLAVGLLLAPQAAALVRHGSSTRLDLADRRDRVVTLVAHVQVAGSGDRDLLRGGDVLFSWRRDTGPSSSWRRLGADRLDRNANASIRVLVRESGPVQFRAAFTGTSAVGRSSGTVTGWFAAGAAATGGAVPVPQR
jgi:hypothetical protein